MKRQVLGLALFAATAAVAGPAGVTNAPAATPKPAPAAKESSAVASKPAAASVEADELPLEEVPIDAVKLAVKDKLEEQGSLIDIDCENATLADILRQYRHAVGANIISPDSTNLQRRVSVSLHGVPWFESLQSILNTRNFRLEPRNGVYFVNEITMVEPKYTRTYPLNHASAEELTEMFNKNYGAKDDKGRIVAPVASSFVGANVIVVTATERILEECEAIIKAVDKAVAQIYIEARFIEATSDAMHKLGLDWSGLKSWGIEAKDLEATFDTSVTRLADDSSAHASSILGSLTGNGSSSSSLSWSSAGDSSQASSSGSTASSSSSSSSSEQSRSGSHDGSKTSSSTAGFSGTLSADKFKLALSAFESVGDTKVFSNPKIVVSNGKEALVDMTTKFPNVRVQATRNTSNGSDSLDISTQLEIIPGEDKMMFAKEAFFSWGITLSVKPRISPDGLINVGIIPTISQLDSSCPNTSEGFYAVKGGDSSAYSLFPVILVKRLTTDFTMKDGSTAVIGGLSKTTEEDVDSGIPYLRKIPWIGPKIFGWKSREKVQKEVVVFVTVGIADPGDMPKDAGLPKNAVVGRQFVEGTKLEPGDRKDAAGELLKLDTRSLHDPDRR